MRAFPYIIIPVISLLCASCTVGEDYRMPVFELPEWWEHGTDEPQEENPARVAWWQAFNDTALTQLIDVAERNNHDVRIANARLQEARTLRQVANAALYPEVNVGGGAQRGNEQNIFSGKAITLYDAVFDASWEIDLFGGAQRTEEAAEAGIEMRQAELYDTMVAIRAEVARNYIDYRRALAEIQIQQEAAEGLLTRESLVRSLVEAGVVPASDASTVEAEQRRVQAQIPGLQARATSAKNQLAVLTGELPHHLTIAVDKVAAIPEASIDPVLDAPAVVIARRPDIRAAERNLASKTALTSAAIADQYPSINIGAALGLRDTSLAGSGTVWSLGGRAVAPIFNAGRLRAEIDAADARQAEALAMYEQAVLKAMAEVETALAEYLAAREQEAALQQAAAADLSAADMAQQRYAQGIHSYIEVLQEERRYYSALQAWAEAKATTATRYISLQKALGL